MDTLAKSNLAGIVSPPLGGLVKVSPSEPIGIRFAMVLPTNGGVDSIAAYAIHLFSVRLFTPPHEGISLPYSRGVIYRSTHKGGFSVFHIDATRLQKTPGGPNKIGTQKTNWPFFPTSFLS